MKWVSQITNIANSTDWICKKTTPIAVAIKHSNADIINLLLRSQVHVPGAVHEAASNRKIQLAKMIIENPNVQLRVWAPNPLLYLISEFFLTSFFITGPRNGIYFHTKLPRIHNNTLLQQLLQIFAQYASLEDFQNLFSQLGNDPAFIVWFAAFQKTKN